MNDPCRFRGTAIFQAVQRRPLNTVFNYGNPTSRTGWHLMQDFPFFLDSLSEIRKKAHKTDQIRNLVSLLDFLLKTLNPTDPRTAEEQERKLLIGVRLRVRANANLFTFVDVEDVRSAIDVRNGVDHTDVSKAPSSESIDTGVEDLFAAIEYDVLPVIERMNPSIARRAKGVGREQSPMFLSSLVLKATAIGALLGCVARWGADYITSSPTLVVLLGLGLFRTLTCLLGGSPRKAIEAPLMYVSCWLMFSTASTLMESSHFSALALVVPFLFVAYVSDLIAANYAYRVFRQTNIVLAIMYAELWNSRWRLPTAEAVRERIDRAVAGDASLVDYVVDFGHHHWSRFDEIRTLVRAQRWNCAWVLLPTAIIVVAHGGISYLSSTALGHTLSMLLATAMLVTGVVIWTSVAHGSFLEARRFVSIWSHALLAFVTDSDDEDGCEFPGFLPDHKRRQLLVTAFAVVSAVMLPLALYFVVLPGETSIQQDEYGVGQESLLPPPPHLELAAWVGIKTILYDDSKSIALGRIAGGMLLCLVIPIVVTSVTLFSGSAVNVHDCQVRYGVLVVAPNRHG